MSIAAINWAKRQTVGRAKPTLLYLAERANSECQTWVAKASMAADMECSPRTSQRHLAELVRKGVIHREERRRENGSRTTDMITLLCGDKLSPPPETDCLPGGDKKSPPPGDKMSRLESTTYSLEPSIKPPQQPGAAEARRGADAEEAFHFFRDQAAIPLKWNWPINPSKWRKRISECLADGGLEVWKARVRGVVQTPACVEDIGRHKYHKGDCLSWFIWQYEKWPELAATA